MYASFALIKFKIMVQFCYREEKSLRHVAMVQCSKRLLDDNKPKKSLKSLFGLFQTSPILFNFIKICQIVAKVSLGPYLSIVIYV